MRLAEYLQRLDARRNIQAGYLPAVYGILCSLTTLRQWFKFEVFRARVVRAWTNDFRRLGVVRSRVLTNLLYVQLRITV